MADNTSKRRYVEQIRVSSKGQNARDTPEVQRHELDAWRRREPGILVERIEHVGTGTVGLKDRPDLQRLKVLAEAHSFDELRLYSVSRASRSEDVQDQIEVFSLCQRAGAVIKASNGTVYDPKDNFHFLRWVMDIGAAAADRKQILRNTAAGKARALRAGGKPAGPTPFGLAYDAEEQQWSIEDEHAKWVRKIYSWARDGVSLLEIVRRVNDANAPSPRGAGWARTTLLRILRSRVYIGEYLYRLRDEAPTKIDVPAIVSFELWEQAQDAITSRRNRPTREGYATQALCRQYAVCGVCGGSMHVWMQSAKLAKKRGRVYYRCSSIQAGKPCGNGYHGQYEIDEDVWFLLVKTLRNQQRLARMAMEKKKVNPWREKIEEAEKRLGQIKKDEAQVFRMMSAGLSEEAGRNRLEELTANRKRTQTALAEAKRYLEDEAAAVIAMQSLKDRLAAMESKLKGAATFDDKRGLLQVAMPLGGKVVVHQDGEITFNSVLIPATAA